MVLAETGPHSLVWCLEDAMQGRPSNVRLTHQGSCSRCLATVKGSATPVPEQVVLLHVGAYVNSIVQWVCIDRCPCHLYSFKLARTHYSLVQKSCKPALQEVMSGRWHIRFVGLFAGMLFINAHMDIHRCSMLGWPECLQCSSMR